MLRLERLIYRFRAVGTLFQSVNLRATENPLSGQVRDASLMVLHNPFCVVHLILNLEPLEPGFQCSTMQLL